MAVLEVMNASSVSVSITYLSAMLIGSMWSMHKHGFPWWEVWVRCTPNFIPGSLSISISKGPWALLTASRLMTNISPIELSLNNCACLHVFVQIYWL